MCVLSLSHLEKKEKKSNIKEKKKETKKADP